MSPAAARWCHFVVFCVAAIPFRFSEAAQGIDFPAIPASIQAQLDDDFPFQGEFAGFVELPSGCRQWTGLQVVALGKGEFQAVEYAGGLPGNGGTMDLRQKLSGHREETQLVLTGADRRISIGRGKAAITDGSGRLLGTLERYHRLSHTLRERPVAGAKVLFDGRDAAQFSSGSVTDDKLLNVGADTKDAYGDFTLHVEFRTPYDPEKRGQGRGNSGVYIQGRYEVQILDSFGLDGLANECGSLYKTQPPLVNMCFPPLSWQTYDIDFTAARFDASGAKICPSIINVRHNGIVVQKDFAIPNKTGAGAEEGPDPRPIRFQNHRDPVHFRNIWIVDRRDGSCPPDSYRNTTAPCNTWSNLPWRDAQPTWCNACAR